MDWSRASRRISNWIGLVLSASAIVVLGATAILVLAAPTVRAEGAPQDDSHARILRLKEMQRRLMMQGAEARMRNARAEAARSRWLAKHPAKRGGARVRKISEQEEGAPPTDLGVGVAAVSGLVPLRVQSVPTNVRCNNPAGEAAGTGQSEEYLARLGNNVLVAWNDGQGFNTGGDIQNYSYSTDGGATFIQPAGGIPHPSGAGGFRWASDPSVAVNEKTGEFYFAALFDAGASNGLAVAKCTFPGGSAPPVWGATHMVRSVSSANQAIDKEWVAVDSLSGGLFVTYTMFDFISGADSIEFQRSQDDGLTWGPALICSSNASAGYVQGSRPITGPNGQVYVTWYDIGQTTSFDHIRMRKSVDGGVSFGSESDVCTLFANYGTGAPGFNRLTGITFPAIAVDRTGGPYRGRIYVSWNESVDWLDDNLGGGGSRSEVEPNDSPGTATSFTSGQVLRGALASTSDRDYFSFAAVKGTNYIFWVDSVGGNVEHAMRVFCTDGGTSLAQAGTDRNSPGFGSVLDWTCPVSGTYTLRIANNDLGAAGGYRIETGRHSAQLGERARDHRDIFVAHSDDGSTWGPPTRANDDPGNFDDWLPEVAVGGDGMPYVAWYDWRDAASNCGGSSTVYISRSPDGGAHWDASQLVTSAATAWSNVASNIAPNQGDYIALHASGSMILPSWADGRNGNPDVWATHFDTGFSIATAPNDTTVITCTTLPVTFSLANQNSVFPTNFTYRLTDTAGWSLGGAAVVTAPAGGAATVTVNVPVPDPSPATNDVTIQVSNPTGLLVQQRAFHLTVVPNGSPCPVVYGFALNSPVPNPMTTTTRIDFTLPQLGDVKLRVYGLNGERVRTLFDGQAPAGLNSIPWDGTDDHGRRVRAGVYFYRLETPGFRSDRRLIYTP
ncbi:MAG: FlgD immunoglobulin-like domain containing protein [Candidatus Eiseniibacteriota bacterium]